MLSVMAKRPRMFFEVDDELKLALKTEALRSNVTVSSLVEKVLRCEFAKAIEEARRTVQQRKKKPD